MSCFNGWHNLYAGVCATQFLCIPGILYIAGLTPVFLYIVFIDPRFLFLFLKKLYFTLKIVFYIYFDLIVNPTK